MGHLVTQIAGASDYYVGGVVAYSNDAKQRLLGVPASVIESHGAVSAEVAVGMAEGARERLRADVGVGVTGIAGPDGGVRGKPVGLTYVAVAGASAAVTAVERHVWPHDRDGNKRAAAAAALGLLAAALTPARRGS